MSDLLKKHILFIILLIVISILTTFISCSYFTSNSHNFISKNKNLNSPASEYTSLNNRITTLESTVSAIGTYYYSGPSAVNIGSNWANTNASVELDAGTWLLVGSARFPTNTTGNYREMYFYNIDNSGAYNVSSAPATGGNVVLNNMVITKITSKKTVSVYARSGTTLSVSGRIMAIKLNN